MSGFGGAFVITLIGVVLTLAFSGFMVISESTMALSDLEKPTPSSLTVEGGLINGPQTFLVNVTNNGPNHLTINKIGLSDVFVTYLSSGAKISEMLTYGNGEDQWHLQEVFVGNTEGDLYNPINITAGTGVWDPGKTLELNLTVSQPIDPSEWYFTMTLDDGGSCAMAF
jgi:hypothetical protein